MMNNIELLALSGKKVFTTEDLAVIWKIPERRRLIENIKYYLKKKRLVSLHKGVYAYGNDYTPLDVAQKLVPLSYLSLYTTSQMHGLIFQYYETVFSFSLRNRKYKLGDQSYEYHRVKEQIFYNQTGLISNGRYTFADKERTITDCLYAMPGFYFDHFGGVNKEKLVALSKTYGNKRLEKSVGKIIKIIDEDK